MYILTLGGYNVVLSSQWLHLLGPILWDFNKIWMQFIVKGYKYTLKGLRK